MKLVEALNKVVHIVLIALMVVLVVSVFCQITLRLFDYSIAWTEELSRYSMIWMTFLGAAYAVATRAHIGMELFVERTSGAIKQFSKENCPAQWRQFSIVLAAVL